MAAAGEPPFRSLKDKGFDVAFVSHAAGILVQDFPEAIAELEEALSNLELPITEIIGSGGGETKFTQRLRKTLAGLNWKKHEFVIAKTVDGVPMESTSHEVDHVRRFKGVGVVAMEIEWNNKDPFFDRDLENFKRLHAEGAISVGVLVTRGSSLQDSLWAAVRKFADDRTITSFDDLAANGRADPEAEGECPQARPAQDRADALPRCVDRQLCGQQVRPGHDALGQVAAPHPARGWQSLPAGADRSSSVNDPLRRCRC